MALTYARVIAGTQSGSADRFGVRAVFRGRRVEAADTTGKIALDQERDEWAQFEFAVPMAARAADPALQNSKTYILQKEPGGSWFVDRWTADGAGAVRAASPTFPAVIEQPPANDLCDCFVIEIGHAAR